MISKVRYGAVALLTAAAITASGASSGRAAGSHTGAQAGNPIKIAVIEPYTGGTSYFGKYADEAWKLAMRKYGSSINGRPIQLVKYDEKCVPSSALEATKQAVGTDVTAVFGPGCTGSVLASLPTLASSGIPHVVIAFGTDVTQRGDKYLWRVQSTNATLNAALARYMASKHVKNFAVVHDTTAYSTDLATTITAAARAKALNPGPDLTYAFGATDFSGQIEKLKSSNVQNVYLGGYDTDVGRFVAQARQLGLTAQFYGAVTFETPDFLDAATKTAATGAVFMTDYVPAYKHPSVLSYTKAWENNFHRTPTTDTTSFYVAASALIKALKVAGTHLTRTSVNQALGRLKLKNTPFGNVSFTANGNLRCPAVFIAQWLAGGKYKLLRNDSPKCAALP